jgi:hypothetical protein
MRNMGFLFKDFISEIKLLNSTYVNLFISAHYLPILVIKNIRHLYYCSEKNPYKVLLSKNFNLKYIFFCFSARFVLIHFTIRLIIHSLFFFSLSFLFLQVELEYIKVFLLLKLGPTSRYT